MENIDDKRKICKGVVSVIIPVYNTAPYLERCLSSIIRQSWKKLEIILVDDGSSDNSLSICRLYQKKDKRIKVLHQSNMGAGMARNAGIHAATGEYISFVDSDDYVSEKLIEKAVNFAKAEKADVVCFGIHRVNSQGDTYKTIIPNLGKTLFIDEEICRDLLPEMIAPSPYTGKINFLFLSACTGLYSKKLLDELRWQFVSEREVVFEDCYSLLRLYDAAKRIAIMEEALYYYCDNPSSLSHNMCMKKWGKLKKSHMQCIQLSRSLNLSSEVEQRLSRLYIDNVIAFLKQSEASNFSAYMKFWLCCRVTKDIYVQKILRTLPGKNYPVSKKVLLIVMRHGLSCGVWLLIKINKYLRK